MRTVLEFAQANYGSPDGLEPRVHRLALQGEDAEGAFVDAVEGFFFDEAVEGFEAEGKFAEGEGALGAEAALAEALEVGGFGVGRAVDDS